MNARPRQNTPLQGDLHGMAPGTTEDLSARERLLVRLVNRRVVTAGSLEAVLDDVAALRANLPAAAASAQADRLDRIHRRAEALLRLLDP